MKIDVRSVLRPNVDVLLVVPPFLYHNRPALGVHLLQGIARARGLEAQVFYANLLFAAYFDEGTHNTFSKMQHDLFLGERIFARAAYGTPPLGRDGGAAAERIFDALRRSFERAGQRSTFTLDSIRKIEAQVPAFLDAFVGALATSGAKIVGATTSFEQTAGAIAILHGAKAANPAVRTLIGGANCEGEMADGIRSLTDPSPSRVDHIFSGESEATFANFLDRVKRGETVERVLYGKPCEQMDAIPTPDFADYYTQVAAFLPSSPIHTKGQASLIYESSRGCWWGAKSHCTFCGLNGEGMASREKSAERVLEELDVLIAAHPVADVRGVEQLDAAGVKQGTRDGVMKYVLMTDNIMPHQYFRTLLPRLVDRHPGVTLWYEQKANLTLAQCRELMRAGVREIQPGIEALSSGLLKLMAKGTTAAQNIALLRYARSTGMTLYWNILVGFPNDELAFYTETLELLPLLVHLQPPVYPCPVVIDRFSPYHDHPERYGVRDLEPVAFYRDVLPETASVEKIAYHFSGTFASAAREHPQVIQQIGAEIGRWRARHYANPSAELRVSRQGGGYVLVDTRGLGFAPEERLDEDQAALALVTRAARSVPREQAAWALERKIAVERDGKIVALAVAEPDLLAELEGRHRRSADALVALAVGA
jgi:hypothetical protein